MSSRLHITLATTALVLMFSANPVTARAQQKLVTADQAQIVDTVSTIFTAARTDDVAKFDSVIASDFYIYDGGARFNGESIMAFIKAQHAAGKRYEWKVIDPDVHVGGNTARVAYVNKGSITDASGTVNQNWLESAFLEKQAGTWKIVFITAPASPWHLKTIMTNDIEALTERIGGDFSGLKTQQHFARVSAGCAEPALQNIAGDF